MKDTLEVKNVDDWNSLLQNAKNGDIEAMNEVASMYRDGLTIDNIEIIRLDPQEEFNWTKKSYESGDPLGAELYADYLSDGEYKYCEKNIDLAIQLYEKAMNAGSGRAAYNMGLEYRNKGNFEKAFELYSKANNSGSYYNGLIIGQCYYYGIGVKKDKRKALKLFKSIDKDKCSQYEIDEVNYLNGKMYLEGEVIEQSLEKARYYLELANI